MALATSFLHPLVEIAQAAEEAGLDRVWTTEGFGGDGIVRAGHLLAHTSRIGIGTGIAYSFTRAPLAVAMAAADLAELSGGRFALGSGAGTRGVRARRFDAAGYDHPAPRTAEYVDLVRAALRSEGGLRFEGRFYQCDFPQLAMPQDAALRAGVPLYAAALNPAMLRAAARSCDGIALHSLATAPAYLRDVVAPAIAGPDRPKLAAWKICVVDDDPAAAADAVRRQLAFYFSTPSYHPVLAGTPWTEVAQRIRDLATELQFRDWAPVAALVPDDMVAAYAVAGDPGSCAEQIAATARRFAAAGIDELVLQLTSGGTPQQTRPTASRSSPPSSTPDRKGRPMLTCDSQIHLFPEGHEERAAKFGQRVIPLATILADMDAAGIDRAVLVPPFPAAMQISLDAVAAHPDRFRTTAHLALDKPEARERVTAWPNDAVVAVRVAFPPWHKVSWLDDGTADWFWPVAAARACRSWCGHRDSWPSSARSPPPTPA